MSETPKNHLTYPDALFLSTLGLDAGATPHSLGLDDWVITDEKRILGSGKKCFDEASNRLLSWQAHEFAGVHVSTTGAESVSLRFGPTNSPCLILKRETLAARTVLVYGTLPGHVETGEEAFIIDLAADGTVYGRCIAFSRPAWIWARLGAPVARRVQLYITRRYLRGMTPPEDPPQHEDRERSP